MPSSASGHPPDSREAHHDDCQPKDAGIGHRAKRMEEEPVGETLVPIALVCRTASCLARAFEETAGLIKYANPYSWKVCTGTRR